MAAILHQPFSPKGRRRRPAKFMRIEQSRSISPKDELAVSRTPYRLPRIRSADDDLLGDNGDGISGRNTAMGPNKSAGTRPCTFISQSFAFTPRVSARGSNLEVSKKGFFPHFHRAGIYPVEPTSARLYAENPPDPVFNKLSLKRRKAPKYAFQEPDDTFNETTDQEEFSPSPILPRGSRSPTKSARSIHWAIQPYKKLHFDKQGQTRNQGPYSREFTVTCGAPNNWLRMKWGRSNTTMTY